MSIYTVILSEAKNLTPLSRGSFVAALLRMTGRVGYD